MTKRAKRRRLAPLAEVLRYENEDVVRDFRKRYDVSLSEARALFDDVLRFLWLGKKTGSLPVLGFQLFMDEMWHTFVLQTHAYERFCTKYFGEFLHHEPAKTWRMSNREAAQAEKDLESRIALVWEELGEKTARRWFEMFPRRYTADFLERARIPFVDDRWLRQGLTRDMSLAKRSTSRRAKNRK